jgi:DNA polymerase III alpha subunit
MRATLRAVNAQSIDEIMIALALYRPGPLTGGLWDAFVRRHRKGEAPAYLHPALQPLLSDTYGVILYQEQVLRTAHELAGLSLADADLLRRAMSHFDPGERMRTLKEKFIEGANKLSGVPVQTGEQIWELMAAFAGYGFPKAHAASYAQIGWRAAWCKTHYPALFMTAVLANWGGYYPQRVYLTEARRMGLSLRSPHINYAHRHFSLHYINGEPVLFMGLDQVKNLTRRTQNRIMRLRPFNSLDDFLMRVDPRSVEAENLVKTGALDGLGTIPDLLARLKRGAWRGGQMSLFELEDRNSAEDWNLEQKVRAEEELLGASLTAHPLEMASQAIADAGALTTLEAIGHLGQRICVAGMRQTWRRSRAAHGERIYVLSLDDLEGTLEVIIPARVYHNARAAFAEHGPYLIEGTLQAHRERGEPFLRAERVALL